MIGKVSPRLCEILPTLPNFPALLQSNPCQCRRVSESLVRAEQLLDGDSTYIIFATSETFAPVRDP